MARVLVHAAVATACFALPVLVSLMLKVTNPYALVTSAIAFGPLLVLLVAQVNELLRKTPHKHA